MRISIKLLSIALLGIGAIAVLILFEHYTKSFFHKKNMFLTLINEIKQEEMQLDYEILKTSFFLYQNYDAITKSQQRLQRLLTRLQTANLFEYDFETLTALERYETELKKKLENIERFKTLNASIKNSSIYLATLLQKLPDLIYGNTKYEKLIEGIISEIFIMKNSLDDDFIDSIAKKFYRLQRYRLFSSTAKKFHKVFSAHVQIFLREFPSYKSTLLAILNAPTRSKLTLFQNLVNKKIYQKTTAISYLFYLIIAFYIFALFMLLYFIYRLDKENDELKRLQQKLNLAAITDDLTNLYNRRAFKKDNKKTKHPFFAIVNINGFKHYNDFYGNQLGDHILRETARRLKSIVPHHLQAKFYRIGGDDFGILIDEDIPIDEKSFAQKIIDHFSKEKIVFKSVDLYISVSIGMSRKRPLLETADMALKYVKKHSNLNYFLYDENLGFFQEVKENIKRSKLLKEAVQEQSIIPHFQPIVHTKTGQIVKYEALARIKNAKGVYESIYKYLPIAKEIKLYDDITKQIIQKSFDLDYKAKKSISINLSMKDIENPKLLSFLGELFQKYPGISKQLTFEILESETLKDYHLVQDFISIIKAQGCKVAIDDFGSGYSNFAHIFNLNIDYIKIDGSLIKNIAQDRNARLVVSTIHFLAQKAGIETIAEFVHSKEVFEVIQEIGITYAQGYYLGEPSPMF